MNKGEKHKKFKLKKKNLVKQKKTEKAKLRMKAWQNKKKEKL